MKRRKLLRYTLSFLVLLSLNLFAGQVLNAQKTTVKRGELSYTGKIIAFHPGYNFRYSRILIEVGEEKKELRFPAWNAEELLSLFQVGDEVVITSREGLKFKSKKMSADWYDFITMEELISLSKDSTVFFAKKKRSKPIKAKYTGPDLNTIFIDRKIKKLYKVNGKTRGVFIDSGELLYTHFTTNKLYNLNKVREGDLISSVGQLEKVRSGEVSPIDGIDVYSMRPLTKVVGKIKSFLYKQNYAYVGLVFSSGQRNIKLSFASEAASDLKAFSDKDRDITVYYMNEKYIDDKNPPALYAAILEGDTIRIERPFWGQADGNHEKKDIEYSGQVQKVVKNSNNSLSIILTKDALIESNHMINQLRHLIKKGTRIKVKGKQRINRPGEIYEKNYKIITPKTFIIDGKEYLLR